MEDAVLAKQLPDGSWGLVGHELPDGSYGVLNLADSDCRCDPDPGIDCWVQLLACGCDDLAQAWYMRAGLIAAEPGGNDVVRTTLGCFRILARFRGSVPDGLQYDPSIHGDFVGTEESCSAAGCPDTPCPLDCVPPNRVFSARGPDCTTQQWCAGELQLRIRRFGNYRLYNSDDLSNFETYEVDSSVVIAGRGSYETGNLVWQSLSVSSDFRWFWEDEDGVIQNIDESGSDSWTDEQVNPSQFPNLRDGISINAWPHDIDNGDQAMPRSGDLITGMFSTVVQGVCFPGSQSQINETDQTGDRTRVWFWNATPSLNDLGNRSMGWSFFHSTDNGTNGFDETVTSSGVFRITAVWTPLDTGVVVVDDCPDTVRVFECNGASSAIINRSDIRADKPYISILRPTESEPGRVVFYSINSAEFFEGVAEPVHDYHDECGGAGLVWPVYAECGNESNTITVDEATKPANAITAMIGVVRYFKTAATSSNSPVPVDWSEDPCPDLGSSVWERCRGGATPIVPAVVRCNTPAVQGSDFMYAQFTEPQPTPEYPQCQIRHRIAYRKIEDDGGVYPDVLGTATIGPCSNMLDTSQRLFCKPLDGDPGGPVDPNNPAVTDPGVQSAVQQQINQFNNPNCPSCGG